MNNNNFYIIHYSQIPEGATLLPTVWQMRRKRDIKTNEITKYKARLTVDGSKTHKGEHYNETYALVASWKSMRLLTTLAIALLWHTIQLDYVQAFPQAPINKPIYFKIPTGFKLKGHPKDHTLKVNNNIYGQKNAGQV